MMRISSREMVHSVLMPILLMLVLCFTSCDSKDGASHLPPAVRGTATRAEIVNLTSALEDFKAKCGHFPSTDDGLQALVTPPTSVTGTEWHPFLKRVPKDAWGRDFLYRCPGKHNTNGFDLYSNGRDGVSKSGGEDSDDIANWSKGYPPQ